MKRFRLRGVTLATCALTGGVLWAAGWFRPPESAARYTGLAEAARPSDGLNTEQAARWRAMQPRHWRALLYNNK